jgi:hypothetical protein
VVKIEFNEAGKKIRKRAEFVETYPQFQLQPNQVSDEYHML